MTEQRNIGIGHRNFFAWISEHRTSVILPESAVLYFWTKWHTEYWVFTDYEL